MITIKAATDNVRNYQEILETSEKAFLTCRDDEREEWAVANADMRVVCARAEFELSNLKATAAWKKATVAFQTEDPHRTEALNAAKVMDEQNQEIEQKLIEAIRAAHELREQIVGRQDAEAVVRKLLNS